jgi:alpha-beta hydrolase superfamily lysophospholipase
MRAWSHARPLRQLWLALLWLPLVAAAAPEVTPQAVRQLVAVDGFELSVWEKEPCEKPRAAILLVHGRTWSALPNFDLRVPPPESNHSVMDAFVRAGYAVYAVDLRGYGSTPRDDTGWLSPPRAARDVVGVLDWISAHHPELKQRPALLGYSRGAHIALLAAQEHPESLSALVLFALPRVNGIEKREAPAEPPRQPTTRAAAAEDFITPGAASANVIDAYVSQAVAANPIRVDWRDEHLFAFDAARLKTPTLILYGANDPLLRQSGVLQFFGEVGAPDRALVILPASDHAAHLENSRYAWMEAVLAFLGRSR